MDRERAVWRAAHDTTSGKIRPTIRRSQTNRAHGPTRTENGPAPTPGPVPVDTHTAKSTTWGATTASRPREMRISGASGSFGVTRYQWPRIIAANTPPVAIARITSWSRSGTAKTVPPAQARAPNTNVAAAANRPAAAIHGARWRRARATTYTPASTVKAASATRRGWSNAGSIRIGEPDEAMGRAWSDSTARIPRTTAQAAVKARNPRVASVRSRARTTATNDPIANPVRTVQLMNARFS